MFSSAYRNRRVFLTGHTGFKGAWLAAWLTKLGAEVTGYALPPAYENSLFDLLNLKDHVRHCEGDIRDLDRLCAAMNEARPEFVFHLAAQALVREGYRDPKTTFDTNVGGSVNVLESIRRCDSPKVLVYVTSDKCYRNAEWAWGYRENDPLGGKDPYSASKACTEIVFSSYLDSFLLHGAAIKAASARTGNVIGGGDWAADRIVPDCIRALMKKVPIVIRNPNATRPWQHVLEPLRAYLLLGCRLYEANDARYCSGWNFGPDITANKTVAQLVADIVGHWGSGEFVVRQDPAGPHESRLLQLNWDKAYHLLGWRPIWDYQDAVNQTVLWYKAYCEGENILDVTYAQIENYMKQLAVSDCQK
jgi:CDP-glucose 4,6-dehydratase